MRRILCRIVSVLAVVVMLCLVATLAACSLGGGETSSTTAFAPTVRTTTSTTLALTDGSTEADAFSTFKSKDPFIQQALPPTSTTVSVPSSGSTSPTSQTTSTYYTTTSYHTTTTSHTTTTQKATTTTAAHLHSLKILSVGTVSGAAVVTFKVDNTVYKDRHTGDVVSSTWGQIKVLDISVTSKVVTLLHGSETLTLAVGQQTYE